MDYAYCHGQALGTGFLTVEEAQQHAPPGSTIHYSEGCIDARDTALSSHQHPEGSGLWQRGIDGPLRWRPFECADLSQARLRIDALTLTLIPAAAIQLIDTSAYSQPQTRDALLHAQETLAMLQLADLHVGILRRWHTLEVAVEDGRQALKRLRTSDRKHLQTHLDRLLEGPDTWNERWLTTPPPQCLSRITIETRINIAERSFLHALAVVERLKHKARIEFPNIPYARSGGVPSKTLLKERITP